jgi:hypothetical protein
VRAFNMGFILACPQSFVNPCGQICGKQGNPLHTRQISVDNYLSVLGLAAFTAPGQARPDGLCQRPVQKWQGDPIHKPRNHD